MKRAVKIGAAVAGTTLVVAGTVLGPEIVSGYRFMGALDAYYADYETNVGAWPQLQDSCFQCHGVNGQSGNAQYASLAGLPATYIENQLQAFAEGRRHDPQMGPLAASLDDGRIAQLADYFSRQSPARNEAAAKDSALEQRGQATVAANACTSCHGDHLMGGPIAPRLAGQGELYLVDQLKAFKSGQRQDANRAMNGIAGTLSDTDIAATARYLAGLTPVTNDTP
ncbi:cystathionine beta-synthase [Marinobacterium nitratireducens]|uniref:Cystathionine beta-synthase n=1 Tax=Marinobacterium nitratireducens TaxID=518897 RepID=A0A917ZM67_9GAMM|nr:c-type cytochrome [Marinobacterium nitratireducens]GGO85287.1 cystathionine beta-synthase [Marinobacterium nitratireducens]